MIVNVLPISTKDMDIGHLSSRFVPTLLLVDKRYTRVRVTQGFLDCVENHESFLKTFQQASDQTSPIFRQNLIQILSSTYSVMINVTTTRDIPSLQALLKTAEVSWNVKMRAHTLHSAKWFHSVCFSFVTLVTIWICINQTIYIYVYMTYFRFQIRIEQAQNFISALSERLSLLFSPPTGFEGKVNFHISEPHLLFFFLF